jgi:hypothetical protein
MKKIIVTTTINPITEAVHKFQHMAGWNLVVVGDKKTPPNYQLENGVYLTPEMQEKYDKDLSDAIGWNCIQRRNIGYLWAYDMGADIIATVDDDNIPLKGWGENVTVGTEKEVTYYETDALVFDPIGLTNYPHLWHRGFPLQEVPKRSYDVKEKKKVRVDVQADFWNGDPDIDAVCRMVHAPLCNFDDAYFPFAANTFSPFNSQNTFLHRCVMKDYFLFPGVGRMDDIWAAYYIQSRGHQVIYEKASVRQDRNEHDLVKDMKAEYLGYEHNAALISDLKLNSDAIKKYIPEQAIRSFELYQKHFK